MRKFSRKFSAESGQYWPALLPYFCLLSVLGLGATLAEGAIVLESWGASVQQNNTAVAATFSTPPVEGNLLIAIVGNKTATTPPPTPAGWSVAISNTGRAPGQVIYYKIAGAAESTSLTVNSYPANLSLGMHIYEYSGASTTRPLDNTTEVTGNGTTVATGAINTTNDGSLILAGITLDASSSFSGWTNGFVEEWDLVNGGGPSERATYAGVDLAVGAAGTYSTSGTAGMAAEWIGQVVVVNPLPPASVVTNTDNAGYGSLRGAIDFANLNPGTTITFDIPDTDPGYQTDGTDHWWRIAPTGVLSTISAANTTIDGSSQTLNRGDVNSRGPEIEIHGGSAGVVHGLLVTGDGMALTDVVVNGYAGSSMAGVYVDGVTGFTITGCYVGTDAVGEATIPNFGGLLLLNGPSTVVIGSPSPGAGNLIAGNAVSIAAESVSGLTLQNNLIGTNAAGTSGLASGIISLATCTQVTIGGSGAGEGNVIANVGAGSGVIYVSWGGEYVIQGNRIGTDHTGTVPIANSVGAITINNTVPDITIGGSGAGEGNVIAASAGGIHILGELTGCIIQGNMIGTGVTGTESGMGIITQPGIQVTAIGASSGVLVGGLAAGEGNIVADSQTYGIILGGSGVECLGNEIRDCGNAGIASSCDGAVMAGNRLLNNGTTASGLLLGSVGNGNDQEVYHNTIHGSGGDGIRVDASGIVVRNNIITGNSGWGINLVGGSLTESNNLITGAATALPNALGQVSDGADGSDIDADPLYIDLAGGDLSLTECTSPAINVGLDLGVDQPDMNGAAAGNYNSIAPDLGAFETACLDGSTLTGRIYEDVDFAGTATAWDGGTHDVGLPNVDVELYGAGDVYVASTVTAADGTFSFTGLADGTYKVRARSATIGDADTPPAAGLSASVPGTWSYPLAEMTWAGTAALIGGQDATVDDTDTADDSGPGDTWVAVPVSGANVAGVELSFSYEVIVNTRDDGLDHALRSDQGCLRQVLKNLNGVAGANETWFAIPTSDPGYSASPLRYTIEQAASPTPYPIQFQPATIDGTTQPGYTDTPIIELDGVNTGPGFVAINLGGGSDNSTVRGLAINRYGSMGILLMGDNSTVAGCYIGTDVTGTIPRPNAGGILASGDGNLIGGTVPDDGNLISGNTDEGIRVTGTSTVIRGNIIGLDAAGDGTLSNTSVGIRSWQEVTIGGTTATDRNIISANGGHGVELIGSLCAGSLVQGNHIGTDATGMLDRGNGGSGIMLSGGATGITIGGNSAGHRNVIAANAVGISIEGAGTDNITIQGNYIGIDAAGTGPLGNIGDGIDIAAGQHLIGAHTVGTGNVISSNGGHGIDFDGADADFSNVRGNYIGTDATGMAPLGNTGYGIRIINGAQTNTIGGSLAGMRNVISANEDGIYLQGPGTSGNIVQGNYIGTDVAGTGDLGNSDRGVQIESGSSSNSISDNVISGNDNGGVIIADGADPGTGASFNNVRGNLIGTDHTGTAPLGNTHHGIQLTTVTDNFIGGTAASAGNVIAHNTWTGVLVQDATAADNYILGNSIHSNGGLGIDLGSDGVTENDGDDSDPGANGLQNFPENTSAITNEVDQLTITGTLTSAPSTAFRIEFFASPTADGSGNGEGETYLDYVDVNTDPGGVGTFNVPLSVAISAGTQITSTATDPNNNTSEFSDAVSASLAGYVISGTVFEDADFAGSATNWDGGVGDAALPKVDVELYDNSDVYQASTTTDAIGSFSFTGLADGTYKVRARSATIGDTDTPPAGGLNATVPGTWPYPLAEMTWGGTAALIGGQNAQIDDTDTIDNAGPGDTWVSVTVSGGDVTGVNLGFCYDLIANGGDDTNVDDVRSKQGSLRQFIKNSNAIAGMNRSWFLIP